MINDIDSGAAVVRHGLWLHLSLDLVLRSGQQQQHRIIVQTRLLRCPMEILLPYTYSSKSWLIHFWDLVTRQERD
jgi:hypothetical protein